MSEVKQVLTDQEKLQGEVWVLQGQLESSMTRCALIVSRINELENGLEALSIRVNQLELAHNRLCHFVGHTTDANTIDRDMGAKV